MDGVRVIPHPNRSVSSRRASREFIPEASLARPLAGCHLAAPPQATALFHRSGLQHARARLLCPLLTSACQWARIAPRSVRAGFGSLANSRQISRGKTRYFRCVDAGFTKCIPTADGGLRGHVPARPGCITPHIRFLFIAPQLRIELPSDPASRRRPCPSPCLRLCENLAIGLSPTK